MARARSSADLHDVLSELAGRPIRIGEIVDALELGRSTYYEQRDEGRLTSADNLLRLAAAFGLNPIELLVRCGLVSSEEAANYVTATGGKRRVRRLQPRMDLPPM